MWRWPCDRSTRIKSAVADAQQQFNRLDADQNGYLDRDELKENIRFQRGLFETIDTDGDEKIFWPEMEAYVRSRAEVAATRCDIVLHDLGHGFFETLDRNHDGRIGLREIRVGAATLHGTAQARAVGPAGDRPAPAAAPRGRPRHVPVVRHRHGGGIDRPAARRPAAGRRSARSGSSGWTGTSTAT